MCAKHAQAELDDTLRKLSPGASRSTREKIVADLAHTRALLSAI
jgi:hypothetical protein